MLLLKSFSKFVLSSENTQQRERKIFIKARSHDHRYKNVPLSSEDHIFPFADAFEISGNIINSQKVVEILDPIISQQRKKLIQKVVSNRTFTIIPVIEGVVNSGNVAAVLRSADGMGYGALHIIEHERDYRKLSQRCSTGAEKWMHVKKWKSPEECILSLKKTGYRIIAAHIGQKSVPVQEIDWTIPSAVVLGNEDIGVSESVLKLVDQSISIPMYGFVESFNISVAAAIILYEARRSRISQQGLHGDLTVQEKYILQAAFYMRHRDQMLSTASEILRRSEIPT